MDFSLADIIFIVVIAVIVIGVSVWITRTVLLIRPRMRLQKATFLLLKEIAKGQGVKDSDLELIEKTLKEDPKEKDWRRTHD